MTILKRKYDEQVPDSAKYKAPQASIPSRRSQIKIVPEGKTKYGPSEMIRIHIPPQGYWDPEYSYLSFDVALQAPQTYCLKPLEVWSSDSNACVYDTGINSTLVAGKAGPADSTTLEGNNKAFPCPIVREKRNVSSSVWEPSVDGAGEQYLYEFVPVGQVYPVLPFSAHGFFNRVVIRSANNTPIEDIQDYDYLSALLGVVQHSSGFNETMGAMLEGWGDDFTRAKMGLSCVQNLQYIQPNKFKSPTTYPNYSAAYSHRKVDNYTTKRPVNGLSPQGVVDSTVGEQDGIGGTKFTVSLNMGLLQQKQNLPLLFSGGLILELYTCPFERCMSFKSIMSKLDATDMPGSLDGGVLNGQQGELVDVTAQSCRLPLNLTSALGWSPEVTTDKQIGQFLDITECPYAQVTENNKDINMLVVGENESVGVAPSDSGPGDISLAQPSAFSAEVNNHRTKNYSGVKARFDQFTKVSKESAWSYELQNVELRADMVQFSQSYDELVAEMVDSDQGLPITFQTFSAQKLLYNGQRSTLTMNERARSIQFALAVFKDPNNERKLFNEFFDSGSKFLCAANWNLPVHSLMRIDGTGIGFYRSGTDVNTVVPSNDITSTTIGNTGLKQDQAQYEDGNLDYKPSKGYWDAAEVYGPLSSLNFVTRKYVEITNPWCSTLKLLPVDAQQESLFPKLIDYQFRVGTRFIPASPVDCSKGAVQAYVELMKAIGQYGTFSGDSARALMPGNLIRPDLYAKRVCTDTRLGISIYDTSSPNTPQNNVAAGNELARYYSGNRFRTPDRFILGQNFSDIPEHASGVDTATQALAVEMALNGASKYSELACYVFLNVRRDMFVRCGGQLEILY